MRKSIIIPTYWARKSGEPWQEGDAVYDHPTPIDQEGTLGRTLESMKRLNDKDFKLVLLICPTTPEVEEAARRQVERIVERVGLNAETYLFTSSSLEEMRRLMLAAGLEEDAAGLLSLSGYSNVRNMCLLAASVLTSDAAILIDDDEVFELSDYVPRALEFLGDRVYGDIVHGVAGYYLNKNGQYYDDVTMEPWMTYWNRFGCKAQAFDKIIGDEPRLKRTPFAFGGAMTIHRELFECVPFDPLVTRGEDIDYLINSRMYGFSFFLDNTLSIKHLPEPKYHPQWKRIREDIYRFVYQRAKLTSQRENGSMVIVSPEDLDPYPGEFLKDDLEDKIFRSNLMLSVQYLAEGDPESSKEALRNIYISQYEAPPSFDAFAAYVETQKQWERIIHMVRKERYGLRAILERDNLSAPQIKRSGTKQRTLSKSELLLELSKIQGAERFTPEERNMLAESCYVKTYYEAETVFSKGDFNDAVSFVLKGCIRLIVPPDDGDTPPVEVGRLQKGDILGESCLVHDTYRLNGTTTEFTELLCIGKSELNQLITRYPALGTKMLTLFLANLSNKVTRANEVRQRLERYNHHRVDESAVYIDIGDK